MRPQPHRPTGRGHPAIATTSKKSLPKMMAQALVDGLVDGRRWRGAVDRCGFGLFMRSLTGNPMDVHLHYQCLNIRRWLLKLDRPSQQEEQAVESCCLSCADGPGNRVDAVPHGSARRAAGCGSHRCAAASQSGMEAARRGQAEHSGYNSAGHIRSWSQVSNLGRMRAVPEVKGTINLATQCANLGL